MDEPLSFRWLGVQGVEFRCAGHVLAIDPFFTRPSAWDFFRRVLPDSRLAERLVPRCDTILVTHSHYDHMLDVPALAQRCGAAVYGSANAGRLAELSGLPERQFHEVRPGAALSLGPFEVDVLAGQHVRFPGDGFLFGELKPGLRAPLRPRDYTVDQVFGYMIRAQGVRILFCPGPALAADILFSGTAYGREYFCRLLASSRPRIFVPLHWDNFFLPPGKPPRELAWPGRISLKRLERLVAQTAPDTRFLLPELFNPVVLRDLIDLSALRMQAGR